MKTKPQTSKRRPSAATLRAVAQYWGRKGGSARMDKMSPEARTAIARHAATVRWDRARLAASRQPNEQA